MKRRQQKRLRGVLENREHKKRYKEIVSLTGERGMEDGLEEREGRVGGETLLV